MYVVLLLVTVVASVITCSLTRIDINRVIATEKALHGPNYMEARTVEEAVDQLSIATSSTPDKHPEKRVKAAYPFPPPPLPT